MKTFKKYLTEQIDLSNYYDTNTAKAWDLVCKNSIDNKSRAKFLKQLFVQNNYQPMTVLDLASGAGNLTVELFNQGYKVDGLDFSDKMISLAKEKLNTNYFQEDMRDFNIGKKYDAIISSNDSLNFLLDENDVRSTMKNVHRHLNPNGMFVFDMVNKYWVKYTARSDHNSGERVYEDFSYTVKNEYNDEDDTRQLFFTFNNKGTMIEEVHKQKMYEVTKIHKLLEESNFTILDVKDGYSFKPVDFDSRWFLFVTRRN